MAYMSKTKFQMFINNLDKSNRINCMSFEITNFGKMSTNKHFIYLIIFNLKIIVCPG